MTLTSTNDSNIPRTVAIVAMGPSHADYMADCISKSGRHQVADETWAINAMAGVVNHDRAFIMDDLAYFSRAARDHEHLDGYKDWLHRHPGPIYTSRVDPAFPGSVLYPLGDVLNSLGYSYFNGTVPYALGYAIHLKIPHVKLYGMDYTQGGEVAESGRACLEYWISVACARGIKITLSPKTTLCDHCKGRPLYGYSIPPKVTWENGRCRVEYNS